MEPLGPLEVRAWWTRSRDLDGRARADCEALLGDDEAARLARLRTPAARTAFAAAHALLRRALAAATGIAPDVIELGREPGGRPLVLGPAPAAAMQVSLSHTEDVVACALTRGREVGVDVEGGRRLARPVALAQRFFAEAEARELCALDDAGARERFLELWTLKEAYAKARGLGVGGLLDRCAFHVAPGRAPRLEPAVDLGDEAAAWQLALTRPAPDFVLALAVRRGQGPDLALRVGEASLLPGGAGARLSPPAGHPIRRE